MVLLTIQKAFDSVDHGILIQKQEALGLNNSALNWCQSYLYEQQQSAEISSITSATTITCGVPQGSILDLMLFLIYVKDITSIVKYKLLIYADGSAIIMPDKTQWKFNKNFPKS